jgi:periplasmic protein TonB
MTSGECTPCSTAEREDRPEKGLDRRSFNGIWPTIIGKAFALTSIAAVDFYTANEIARAAGVPPESVVRLMPAGRKYVGHGEAVQIGKTVHALQQAQGVREAGEFEHLQRRPLLPLLVSSGVHAGIAALLVFLAGLNFAPRAAALRLEDRPNELMRMVFLQTPGPGGGGGGGGLQQPKPAPKAMREGTHRISSPVPLRKEPKPIVPAPAPPEPKPEPPLKSEPLPVVVAPIITAPADPHNRVGVLEQTTADADNHGAGKGGGAGTGTGTGLGAGDGSGIGPGSGGGTGGGPYRGGSGIEAPRLLREVKADYTEDARQRNITGEVVMEIVVRRDGSIGDVRVIKGLGGGLNDRAIQAVRQWRFAPATRQGTPVDVIVEVAVEFKQR